jgi:endonuclease/exonuclease/phosphatase (EEP) superfamily protein YafD
MKNLLFPILLSLTLNSQAAEAFDTTSRYFKVPPISEAHTSFGIAEERTLNPESIKVLVWNIKKAMVVGWPEEFATYGAKKDLFLIQEAYENDIFLKTLKSFDTIRWDMGISFIYRRYADTPTGNMVGSEVSPLEVIVRHSPDHEPVTNTPKAMVIAKYPVGNEELLVISVHGINFNSNQAFFRHMAQAQEEIKNHRGPVFFAGDFNTHTNGRVSYLETITKELGMVEVEFKNGSYRSRAPVTKNFFDHAFVRGLKVKEAEVLKDSFASDHKPMTLELALLHQKG